jgi:hypothetical protein
VLEIAARQIIPVLVTEVSTQALRHAARTAAESSIRRLAASRPAPTLQPLHTSAIISEMPGRVRLQVAGLRGNPARAAALRERLRTLAGVHQVEASALTGKALVRYDRERTTLPRILAAAETSAPCRASRAKRCTPALALVGN